MNKIKPYLWRLIFTVLGLTIAILFMTLGFLRTALILICCCIGYYIGMHIDKNKDIHFKIHLPEWFWFWQNK